jgi:hypothetical protein
MSGMRNSQSKLAWAQGHLKLLDLEIGEFANSNPYILTREDDPEQHSHVLRFRLLDVPDPICLIAADAVYSIRTSLDQLVWSLARLKGIPKRTTFPIIKGPVLTKSRLVSFNDSLFDVPSEAICEIDALQPYHRGSAFKTHPLWRLDEICNLDKHRRIPANGSASIIHFPNLTAEDRRNGIPTIETSDDGFEASVPIDLKHKLDVYPKMQYAITFGGDISGISEDFKSLMEIYKFVAESVLPRFERFFTK